MSFLALEYHTLVLFSEWNHYEIQVYTFFSLVTEKPSFLDGSKMFYYRALL